MVVILCRVSVFSRLYESLHSHSPRILVAAVVALDNYRVVH